MIMAEVVFDGDMILINDAEFSVNIEVSGCDVYNKYVGYLASFDTLEQAIAYCLEQTK